MSEAFGWAWKKFRQNAAALIVPVLVYGLLLGAAYGLIALSTGMGTGVGTNSGDSTSAITNLWPGEWAMMVIGYLLVFAVGVFAQSAFLTGCLDIADGRPVTIGSFFRPRNFGTVILAALLVSVLSTLASALCFLPGLIFGIFAMFTVPFAIDRAQPPVTALTASLSTVWSNFGNALLAWLVEVVVIVVGALACGLGLLVGLPVAALILIYTFRTLSGGRVVPLEQGYPQGPPPGYQPS
ncbi:hypothetical protein FPZ47_24685 [Mycobacterium helveticum]|uniref:DUF975 family protein n=1 Tax=Mycobacterium helveticum TaxID=2592811 RepID=A0A557XBP1_9MYCO|nr:hypothetical protein FPZ46_24925 [Mycobacterium helveticum]TVS82938.1 hypothetical protein FPZ47_24685 [Mycobacterium helveticum]